MDVGQVTFTIQANGLDATLNAVTNLENKLNGMDGKTYGKNVTRANKAVVSAAKKSEDQMLRTKQKALKLAANAEQKYAVQQHKREQKYEEGRQKAKHDAMRMTAEAEKKYAIQEHARQQKQAKQEETEAARREAKQQRARERLMSDTARAEKKYAIQKHERQQKLLKEQAEAPIKYQKQMESNLVNMGARMQTFGATVERMTTPFTNVVTSFGRMAGYMLYGKVFQSVQGMFSRYDTMHTYEKILKNIGLDASKKFVVGTGKARTALDNLEQSVLGLPTGLDEIVASMRVYAGITGDVEKATKVAIAANNAFVAGGMDETRTRMAERQLQNILSNGELTAMQWNSLQKNMPMAFNAVARELGYAQKDAGKLLADLKSSKVSADEFMDAFIKVGTQGKIKNAANVMKQTWSSVSQNITNAFNRMGEGLIKSLDTVFKATDGRTFLQHVLGIDANGKDVGGGIKHMIDDLSQSAQNWIKANPKAITDFFKTLSEIDIKGIASAYAQFGGVMLKFYAGAAKLLGGNNGFLLKGILGANIIAKMVRIVGGLTKGLAGPISKIATFFAFKGGLGGIFKLAGDAAGNAGRVVRQGSALVGASKTMKSVALTWQGVANKALNIGAIFVVAESIKVLSEAMKNFDDVKFTPQTVGALGTAVTVTGLLTKFVVGMGNVIGASKGMMIGTAIGTGTFYAITKGIEALGNAVGRMGEGMKNGVGALKDIDTLKIPSPDRIAKVGAALRELASAFTTENAPTSLGSAINAWSKGLQADNITKIANAMDSIKNLSKLKLKPKALKQAKKNFKAIQKFSIDIMGLFNGEEEEQMEAAGGTSRSFKKGSHTLNPTSYAEWKNKVRDFAETISSLATSFADITTMLDGMKAFNKSYGKIGKGDAKKQKEFWKNLRERVDTIATELYGFAGNDEESPFWKLQQAASKLKGADYSIVTKALGEIPKMVTAMQEISNLTVKVNEKNLDKTLGKLGTFIEKVQKLFTPSEGGTLGGGGIQGTALDVSALSAAVAGVKKAIGDLNSIPVAKDMSGVVKSVKTSIDTLRQIGTQIIDINITIQGGVTDSVGPALVAAKTAITNALDSIQKKYTKKVSVYIKLGDHKNSVSSYLKAVKKSINREVASIPSSVNKTVNVNIHPGFNDPLGLLNSQHGGMVYRAGGGSLRRGTDTVHAMLTPGEWVMNRHATSMLGSDVLNRLNHLDIRGALNSLSLRAGQIQNKTINNNNTKNANVTVNNYHSDGVGYGRAGRFVRAL